jgi:endonuclease-8
LLRRDQQTDGVPEGDTLERTAARLRPALEGRALVRFDAPKATRRGGRVPRPGTTIERVEAVGKHLLIRFADGLVLRTHMRMTGSWHLYRTGERWRRPAATARAIVEVEGWVAVCFSAPLVELTTADATGARLAHLGPDLTEPDADIDTAAARMAAVAPGTEVKDALLDQRVAAGVGNAWASETLFACGVDPFTPVAALDDVTRRKLIATASALLRAGPAQAVYGRERRPCPRCGTPIRRRRQGEHARSTYWCPTCQR